MTDAIRPTVKTDLKRALVKATGWSCGNITEHGGGLGIRISHSDRDAHFDRAWVSVIIRTGERDIEIPISASFWNRCSELRSKEIGRYLLDNGRAPWPKGKPPTLELVPEGERRFKLEIIRCRLHTVSGAKQEQSGVTRYG